MTTAGSPSEGDEVSRAAAAGAEAAEAGEADAANARDLALMRRVRTGDREAFAELVSCYHLRVIGTVARMLGPDGAAEAEDIAQQVFVRIWRSAPRYEPTAKFTTWLYTITRNLVFNELRRRRVRPTVSLEAPAAGGDEAAAAGYTRQVEDPEARAQAPDASLLQRELQEAVDAAIATLPESQRLALVLRRYEELSYEEIAGVLGLTVPAVKSLLFRARSLLREKLARYLEP